MVYAESAAQGRAVIQTEPKSGAAIEMAQLATELIQTNGKTKKERKAA